MLLRSEQNAYGSPAGGSVSIDMDSLQDDRRNQMQLLEQQVGSVNSGADQGGRGGYRAKSPPPPPPPF